MNDKGRLPTHKLLSRSKCERAVYVGKGKYRTINARRVIWSMVDYLVKKSNYPIEELIDDCIAFDGEGMLEWSFEENVIRAVIAHKMIEDGYANYNFVCNTDPVTGRCFVPINSPVWHMHYATKPARIALPKITSQNRTATSVQYEGRYNDFLAMLKKRTLP